MELKTSFRTSSAPSNACHTARSPVSHPMCLIEPRAVHWHLSEFRISQRQHTHAGTQILCIVENGIEPRWAVKPSNLSQADKHPPDTVTFSLTQATCEGVCIPMNALVRMLVCLVSGFYLCMQKKTGLFYKEQN